MGGTKIKGLLKGLRYISNIFESDGKEQEMEIGYPTDVKHVAHIGWDGPSLNSPGWMNEFRSAPLSATVDGDRTETNGHQKYPSAEFQRTGSRREPQTGDPPAMPRPRTSRRKDSSTADSPNRDPARESFEGSHHSKRHGRNAGSGGGTESPAPDLPSFPKQSRRRKAKGTSSSGGGSSRSSRNKGILETGPEDQLPEQRQAVEAN